MSALDEGVPAAPSGGPSPEGVVPDGASLPGTPNAPDVEARAGGPDVEVVGPPEPTIDDVWAPLRRLTPSRIGIGRSGDALPTASQLELRLAHARARDAVHAPLDPQRLGAGLGGRTVIEVRSAAPDRATYLQRPDLGRRLDDGEADRLRDAGPAELAVVLADGLSPRAIHDHAAGFLEALAERLPELAAGAGLPVVVAHQARVALGDQIGEALGARLTILLVGERPGLSAADSLGVYLTHGPRPGRSDAERNCVSNVRPPHGQTYAGAAATTAALVTAALDRGVTGVALKDEGGVPVVGPGG